MTQTVSNMTPEQIRELQDAFLLLTAFCLTADGVELAVLRHVCDRARAASADFNANERTVLDHALNILKPPVGSRGRLQALADSSFRILPDESIDGIAGWSTLRALAWFCQLFGMAADNTDAAVALIIKLRSLVSKKSPGGESFSPKLNAVFRVVKVTSNQVEIVGAFIEALPTPFPDPDAPAQALCSVFAGANREAYLFIAREISVLNIFLRISTAPLRLFQFTDSFKLMPPGPASLTEYLLPVNSIRVDNDALIVPTPADRLVLQGEVGMLYANDRRVADFDALLSQHAASVRSAAEIASAALGENKEDTLRRYKAYSWALRLAHIASSGLRVGRDIELPAAFSGSNDDPDSEKIKRALIEYFFLLVSTDSSNEADSGVFEVTEDGISDISTPESDLYFRTVRMDEKAASNRLSITQEEKLAIGLWPADVVWLHRFFSAKGSAAEAASKAFFEQFFAQRTAWFLADGGSDPQAKSKQKRLIAAMLDALLSDKAGGLPQAVSRASETFWAPDSSRSDSNEQAQAVRAALADIGPGANPGLASADTATVFHMVALVPDSKLDYLATKLFSGDASVAPALIVPRLRSLAVDHAPAASYFGDWIRRHMSESLDVGGTTTAVVAETFAKELAALGSFDISSIDTVIGKIDEDEIFSSSARRWLHSDLRAFEALKPLALEGGSAITMLGAGLQSASQVVAFGRGRLSNILTKANLPNADAQASQIFNRARARKEFQVQVVGHMAAFRSAQDLAVFRSPAAATTRDAIVPDWRTLFGSQDACECKPSESIIGPGAYLVDILEFLRHRAIEPYPVPGQCPHSPRQLTTALEVLLERRPDLVHIDFTEANAMTELPYVDLLCELLEDRVLTQGRIIQRDKIKAGLRLRDIEGVALAEILAMAPISLEARFTAVDDQLTGEPACPAVLILRDAGAVLRFKEQRGEPCHWYVQRLRQTTLSAEELAAEPEHTNPKVYTELGGNAYGYALPFSLGETLLHAYLKLVDSSRGGLRIAVDLAETRDLQWAADALKLEMATARAIVEANGRRSEQFFGLAPGDMLPVRSASDLLPRFDLQFAQLDALCESVTFGGNRGMSLEVQDDRCGQSDPCDTRQIEVRWDGDEQAVTDDSTGDVLVRFARLRRHLGWSVEQLDRALCAARIGDDKLDHAFLAQLAGIAQLATAPFEGVDAVLALFSDLTGALAKDDANSGYRKVYLDPRRSGLDPEYDGAILTLFRDIPHGRVTWCTMDKDPANRAALATCLGLNRAELDHLIDAWLTRTGQADKVTVAQMSHLYALALLRETLSIRWDELGALAELYFDLSKGRSMIDSPLDLIDALALDSEIRGMDGLTPPLLRFHLFNRISGAPEAAIDAAIVKDDKIFRCLATVGVAARSIPMALTDEDAKQLRGAGTRFGDIVFAPLTALAASIERDRLLGKALPKREQIRATGDKAGELLEGRFTPDQRAWDSTQRAAQVQGLVDEIFSEQGGIPDLLRWAMEDAAYQVPEALKNAFLCYLTASLRLAASVRAESPEALDDAQAAALKKELERSGILFATGFATPFLHKRNLELRRTALISALAEACDIASSRAAALMDSLRQTDASGTTRTVATLFMHVDMSGSGWPAPNGQPGPGFPDSPELKLAADAVRCVGKVAKFVETMRLDDEMVRWMSHKDADGATRAGMLGWMDLDDIGASAPVIQPQLVWANTGALERWRHLAAATRVARQYPAVTSARHSTEPVSVCTVFERAMELDATAAAKRTAPMAPLIESLSRLTAFPADLVQGLLERALGALGKGAVAPWSRWLDRLGPAIESLRRVGLSVAQAAQATDSGRCGAAAAKLDPESDLQDAMMIRKILKKRFRLDAWIKAITNAQGSIRERKRDALLAYLVGTGKFTDGDDVFEYLLVDPKMGACMPSSRLVQAHGTVQMFVQRCLMGLEPKVTIPKGEREDWAPWSWMKEYRVWEANRKVFLFPENWIEPELRDDKSEFYVEFENALNQNVLEQPNIERAVIQYLHKLNDVAKLDICATYYQFDDRDPVMHVVGRTTGEPHAYFYRTWVGERRWTPWERIDLDIEGDHLLLYMRNGRMHLAWPVFIEQGQKKLVEKLPETPAEWDNVQPESTWQIKLAVSEYSQSQWMPRKVTSSALRWPQVAVVELRTKNPPARIRLAVHELPHAEILVSECTGTGILSDTVIGVFSLDTCSGAPQAAQESAPARSWYPSFPRARFDANRYVESDDKTEDALVLLSGPQAFNRPTVLSKTPGRFSIQVPQQASPIDLLFAVLRLFVSPYQLASIPTSIGAGLPFSYSDRSVSAMFSYRFDFDGDARRSNPISMSLQLAKAIGKALEVLEMPSVRTDIRAAHAGNQAALEKLRELFNKDACKNVLTVLLKIAGATGRKELDRGTPPEQETDALKALRTGPIQIKAVSRLAHPLACELVKEAYRGGMDRLYDRPLQLLSLYELASSVPTLDPVFKLTEACRTDAGIAAPTRNGWEQAAGFESWDASSGYNWEIFFHMPFHVAVKLAGEAKFKEALDWFHHIFNPVGVRSEVAGAEPEVSNYWITKPFFEHEQEDYEWQRIQFLTNPGEWLESLESEPSDSADSVALRSVMEQFAESIIEWRNRPFVPHQVARHRWVAFQKTVVMRYVDTLLQWGDSEFRRFQMEPVFRAAQLYVLAARLLGPRPRSDVKAAQKVPQFYEQMEAGIRRPDRALDKLAEAIMPPAVQDGTAPENYQFNLYSDHFCVPQNDKLVELWDRVEDRLFKIRHCQDIEGIKRKLSLYAPPIDPALLVRATAAGLSIDQILADLGAPLPHYRFSFMHQKATEFAHEVKALGSELMSAIERKEGDELMQLRSRLDITYARAALGMRRDQVKEAGRQLEGIKKTIETATYRKNWYETKMNEGLSSREKDSLKLTETSMGVRLAGQALQLAGSAFCVVPQFELGTAGFGGTPVMTTMTGGTNWASAVGYLSTALSMVADYTQTQAGVTSVRAGHERRDQEWGLQKELAGRELEQLEQQLKAAEIRIEIVQAELQNHELQIEHLQASDEFIRNKFSNAKLYEWMVRQVTATYYKTYQLAVDLAMKAERCMEHELPAPDGSPVQARYINAGYWDGMRKGLLSGNGLMHDLKRMEVGYMERNVREFEITKHVSLAAIDPLQLLQLRATGGCSFTLNEPLFDLDFPGHYRRRIKSVSLSLPCIAGPYTSVSCQLTLLRSLYKPKSDSKPEESVFDPVQVTSIATSSGQNDSGMFELNFRDERYLPFEGAGAISEWRLQLPDVALRMFDYAGISDAVLHIRYTSRDGGAERRDTVSSSLAKELKKMKQAASHKGVWSMVSLRNELPDVFAVLRSTGQAKVALDQQFLSGLTTVVTGAKKIAPNGVMFAVLRSPQAQQAPALDWQVGSGAQTRIELGGGSGALQLSTLMGGPGGTPEERSLGAAFFKDAGVLLYADKQHTYALSDVLVLLNFSEA
ncbi:hypothetical protein F2P45_18715 [Massilia sp. CCM 8733]|uniref:Uncharacterized protein n=1 Tax=Massilia mucilaginosa TaxID=2609282 RepID=A0ABX0NWK1_9BURK|nr:neuraminidase-like domain-containing protein [Massilia mucilaginosa]NHZ91035.1 hypothetical protein [Massilia mucilaginosa]